MIRRKKKKKKSNFVSEQNSDLQNYKKGAMIGALVGGIGGLILGKRVILSIIIGAIGGGYISYQLHKEETETIKNKFNKTKNNEDAD